MSFAEDLKANCNKLLEEIDAKCYSICYQWFTNIVMLSPSPANPGYYSKGLFANQWYPMIGGGYSSALTGSLNTTGSDSIARVVALADSKEFYGKNGVMTFTNNTGYGTQVEYLGWPGSHGGGSDRRGAPYRPIATALGITLNDPKNYKEV